MKIITKKSSTLAAAVAIPVLALTTAACGNSGSYKAGYDTAVAGGSHWIHVQIDEGGVTPLGICMNLYELTYTGPIGNRKSPYDDKDYMQGCYDGIDHVYGSHVPGLPGGK